ncbi:unnamed protein product, partial [Choristocarpus tenellus]
FRTPWRQAPQNAGHHHNIAPLLLAQGDVKGAIHHYRRAIELNPHCNSSKNDLAVILWKKGKWEAALAALRQVIMVNPNHFEGHLNLCAVYHSKAHLELAAKHARKAVHLNPSDPRGHRALGQVLDEMGNSTESLHHRKIAVRRGPSVQGVYQREDTSVFRLLAVQLMACGGPERPHSHAFMDSYRALSGKAVTLANSVRTEEIL